MGLNLKLLVGLVLATALFGAGWAVRGERATIYEQKQKLAWDQAERARMVVVADKLADNLRVMALQQQSIQKAERKYVDLQIDHQGLGNRFASLMRQYSDLRIYSVPPCTPGATGTPCPTDIARDDRALDEAAAGAIQACQDDADRLIALQSLFTPQPASHASAPGDPVSSR